jgi:hypothetical protein
VPTALRREVVATAVGDPLTVDYCAGQGTRMLAPVGYTVQFSPIQYIGGCTWRLREHNKSRIDVTEYADTPANVSAPFDAKRVTVAGLAVDEEPLNRDSGICVRQVHAPGIVVSVEAYAINTARTSRRICAAADAVTFTTAKLIRSARPPQLPLQTTTITALDMCKVAVAAHLDLLKPLQKAKVKTNNFGADCQLSNPRLALYVYTAISRPGAVRNERSERIGSHVVLASDENSASFCSFTARQALTADGVDYESIEFSLNAQNYQHPPRHLCASARPIVAGFLDAAGLR